MHTLATFVGPPNPYLQVAKVVLVSAGLVTLAGGAVWTVWILRTVRRDIWRHRTGRCLHCGYDLRYCQDRCSECGSPIRRPVSTR